VREPIRFTIRQARRRGDLGRYRLRGSGVVVHLRHNTPDMNTLDEIFLQGHYEPPDAVARVLARADQPLDVLDLGANVGLFAAQVLGGVRRSRVVCVEPDSANAAVIRRSIEANPELTWELVEACAGAENGEVRFTGGLFTQSRIEAAGAGDLVPAVDVFPLAEGCTYLKMDVEGAEWAILADRRFGSLSAKVVALEYHEYLCPDPDPAGLARRRLEEAGYEVAESKRETAAVQAMLWGWKPD
jgi:FkbM family methyltransferase